ncbi:MAG: MBL fold metallo-hydrolase [Oscillospiraceae bacterium]|nr:MBL fold metallo-hydrolase [Oscillospiraceae bacterium]
MELTALGIYGPYGKAGTGAASGYLVKNQEDYLVMDMGSGTLSRLMAAVDIKKINHIFISHLHFDHTSDLLPFRYLLEEINHTVNIYTHKENTEWYKILFEHPNFNVINIDENSNIKIGSMTLEFLPMKHTVTDYAVIIKGDKTLCYTGDTLYNENIPKCFEKSDCVLADCSKPKGFRGPHMNVSDAVNLSEKYRAKIITTHLSADFDPTEETKDFPNITVAEELRTYII